MAKPKRERTLLFFTSGFLWSDNPKPGWKALLFQTGIGKFPNQGIEYGEQRDPQDHAQDAEQAAAQNNRENDPKGREAGGIAEDFWPDELAVQLLKHQR